MVHKIHLTLKANDSVPEDITHILLNAYKHCLNQEFQQFANRTADAITDGTKISLPNLMSKAPAKYNMLIAKGKWNISNSATELIALQAKFTKYKNKYDAAQSAKLQAHQDKKKSKPVIPDVDLPAWKKTPLATNEMLYKMVLVPNKEGTMVNLMHWWCHIHQDNKGMWCTHYPKV